MKDLSVLFGALAIASGAGLIGFIWGGCNEFFKAGGVKELTRENFILRTIISDASTGVRKAGAPAGSSPSVERQRHLSHVQTWTT